MRKVIVVFFVMIAMGSASKPELDANVPGIGLWYLRMWHGRF